MSEFEESTSASTDDKTDCLKQNTDVFRSADWKRGMLKRTRTTVDQIGSDINSPAEHSLNGKQKAQRESKLQSFSSLSESFAAPEECERTSSPLTLRKEDSTSYVMKSFPIFDMRRAHRLAAFTFYKIKTSHSFTIPEDLKLAVCQQFSVSPSTVHIIEERGLKEEMDLKTFVIILPEHVQEKCITLLIEVFEDYDPQPIKVSCCRISLNSKLSDLKAILQDDLNRRHFALCTEGNVVNDATEMCCERLRDFGKVQVIVQSFNTLHFTHHPRPDVSYEFTLETDMTKSVKEVKVQFENHFKDELNKLKRENDGTCIQFCLQERLLRGEQCVGLVMRKNLRQENIRIHFASQDCISVDLKYKFGRKHMHKLLIVDRDISTAALRAEVSKHLIVDPKAVKLIFEDKLIDEHENLAVYFKNKWKNGCQLSAGVKKFKTLRIKHPFNDQEVVAFEMYMLETVSTLKRKVAERFSLNDIQISLFCRGMKMENKQPLQHYPIKNNIEICMCIYKHRLVLNVLILKCKTRISVIVDDCTKTTVDDLLSFCAIKYNLDRRFLGAIFKSSFLDKNTILVDTEIQAGDVVVITNVDNPHAFKGSIMHMFMTREDGHCVARVGTITAGIVMLASKTAAVPRTGNAVCSNEFGPTPTGIYACEDSGCLSSLGLGKMDSSIKHQKKLDTKTLSQTPCLAMNRKVEFLKRGRQIIKMGEKHLYRYVTQTNSRTRNEPLESSITRELVLKASEDRNQPVFFIGDQEVDKQNVEFSLDEETGKKTIINDHEASSAATKLEARENPISPKNEVSEKNRQAVCPKFVDCDGNTAGERVCQCCSCQHRCNVTLSDDTEVQTSDGFRGTYTENITIPSVKNIKKSDAETQNPCQESSNAVTSKHSKQVGFSEDMSCLRQHSPETSGCESSHQNDDMIISRRNSVGDIDRSRKSKVTSGHGEDCFCRKCVFLQQETRCPFLLRMRKGQQMTRRTHTLSEGSVAVDEMLTDYYLHHSRTDPRMDMIAVNQFGRVSNAQFETSGITINLLLHAARLVGKKWKHLLRKLGTDEAELSDIEHKYRDSDLHELAFQALLTWKQREGVKASVTVLISKLEDIGLRSVAESLDGHFTA